MNGCSMIKKVLVLLFVELHEARASLIVVRFKWSEGIANRATASVKTPEFEFDRRKLLATFTSSDAFELQTLESTKRSN